MYEKLLKKTTAVVHLCAFEFNIISNTGSYLFSNKRQSSVNYLDTQ